ncbi:MAG: hypothetical protein methR_P1134 [Methyloprofundus sp.]|nr:MAG: hypothetical protein methR_P1134 [Methyloprofundus sp.]
MIEIIPNWHPLLVHFTVGLLSTSVLFYLASAFLSRTNSWKQQWLNMANWSLWSGCLFAIGTAIAGWLAYNSVAHDSASHAAMTLHRNLALPTAATFLLLGLWAIYLARKDRQPGFLFLSFSTIAAGLLMVTGWLGAEAVYRYGLGVQSLPVIEEGADGHNHSHGSAHDDSATEKDGHQHQHETTESEHPLTESTHQHGHEETGGHDHSHDSAHEHSATEKGEHQHQHDTTEIKPPLTEGTHQHNHDNKEKLPEIEQLLKHGGHQHEHINKVTTPIAELTHDAINHSSKIMPENITVNLSPSLKTSNFSNNLYKLLILYFYTT